MDIFRQCFMKFKKLLFHEHDKSFNEICCEMQVIILYIGSKLMGVV